MTILHVCAILIRDAIPDAGVHNITDGYLNVIRTEHLESIWSDATKAIEKAFDFLDNHLCLPGPSLVPYRYFYMTLASYLFRNKTPDYGLLKQYFWYFSFHNNDFLSNTTHLRDHVRRLREARDSGMFEFEPFELNRERLRGATYSSRGRLSRALLSLYANQDPRDWQHKDRSVLTNVYYELTDHPNLHHIFPLDFCEKNLGEHGKNADSLLNIAYLTQITNLQISNRNPLEYLKDYVGTGFDVIQRTHLLPGELAELAQKDDMPYDALDSFIEKRMELIIEKLRDYLGDIPFRLFDSRETDSATDGS